MTIPDKQNLSPYRRPTNNLFEKCNYQPQYYSWRLHDLQ